MTDVIAYAIMLLGFAAIIVPIGILIYIMAPRK